MFTCLVCHGLGYVRKTSAREPEHVQASRAVHRRHDAGLLSPSLECSRSLWTFRKTPPCTYFAGGLRPDHQPPGADDRREQGGAAAGAGRARAEAGQDPGGAGRAAGAHCGRGQAGWGAGGWGCGGGAAWRRRRSRRRGPVCGAERWRWLLRGERGEACGWGRHDRKGWDHDTPWRGRGHPAPERTSRRRAHARRPARHAARGAQHVTACDGQWQRAAGATCTFVRFSSTERPLSASCLPPPAALIAFCGILTPFPAMRTDCRRMRMRRPPWRRSQHRPPLLALCTQHIQTVTGQAVLMVGGWTYAKGPT